MPPKPPPRRHPEWVNACRPSLIALLITGAIGVACQDSDPSSTDESRLDMTSSTNGAPSHTNRLINETSPYLLQHAHNPVDWYPWGQEAFEAARREQKPIFLSIGYSTCYWCHVMERESFEDEATAAVMNENFICIKVDREERPDVDDIYMTATQLLTRSGGWPMSVFLLPPPPEGLADEEAWVGLQPFWAGTYFPPEPRFGRASFTQILTMIDQAWETQRTDVIAQAKQVAEAVKAQLGRAPGAAPVGAPAVELAVSQLLGIFDPTHGGFGSAPKFPQPVFLEFFIAVRDAGDGAEREQIDHALRFTLDRMATGGMYDQIGGGFHRYSTDARWLVPHFEKMLYDNGQLAALYARASRVYDDPFCAEIAAETCDYVLREMTDERGAFYSAQDAEVNGREGLNYLWTPGEVEETLRSAGAEDLVPVIVKAYGLEQGPNFQDPHHADEPKRHVIFLVDRPSRLADEIGLSVEELNDALDRANTILYETRRKREQPHLDDKIIASWNGLMIDGLAEAGSALERPEYVEAAKKAWSFINENMRDEDGGLYRTFRKGRANVPAFAEDYAMLVRGLITLHRATNDQVYLDAAISLVDIANERFRDPGRGGFFDTLEGRSDLFVRGRSTNDGAVPSANGVMLNNLITLHELTGEDRFLDVAIATLASMSAIVSQAPVGPIESTRGLARLLDAAPDTVAAIGAGDQPGEELLDAGAPVNASLSAETVTLSPDQAVEFTLLLSIAEGFHLNAHDPGDESLIGLQVEMAAAEEEHRLVVSYPEGHPFTLGDQRIFVYEGDVEIPLHLESRGSDAKEFDAQIVVTWQACTETECLAPRTTALPITIRSK